MEVNKMNEMIIKMIKQRFQEVGKKVENIRLEEVKNNICHFCRINFEVDGIKYNDTFGYNSCNYPNTIAERICGGILKTRDIFTREELVYIKNEFKAQINDKTALEFLDEEDKKNINKVIKMIENNKKLTIEENNFIADIVAGQYTIAFSSTEEIAEICGAISGNIYLKAVEFWRDDYEELLKELN